MERSVVDALAEGGVVGRPRGDDRSHRDPSLVVGARLRAPATRQSSQIRRRVRGHRWPLNRLAGRQRHIRRAARDEHGEERDPGWMARHSGLRLRVGRLGSATWVTPAISVHTGFRRLRFPASVRRSIWPPTRRRPGGTAVEPTDRATQDPGKAAAAIRAGANLAPDRAVGRRTWEEFLTDRIGSPRDTRSELSRPRL